MENPENAVVMGIAKRLDKELCELSPQTHQAVVQIVSTLFQHRVDTMQIKIMEQQQKQKFADTLGMGAVPQPIR